MSAIIATRQERPFTDLEDLLTRVDHHQLNRRVLESLVKSGAFDSCGGLSRRELIERIEDGMRAAQSVQKDRNSISSRFLAISAQATIVPRKYRFHLSGPSIRSWPLV